MPSSDLENVPLIRAKVCEGLEPIGIKIDQSKNEKAIGRSRESDISADDSRIRIFVIPTNEELVMVEDVKALLEGKYDEHQRNAVFIPANRLSRPARLKCQLKCAEVLYNSRVC